MSDIPEIPEIKLRLAPQTTEAREVTGFRMAGAPIGTRSKLGGAPDWIQRPAVPTCSCGNLMSFYGQLDSIGDKIILADCGMVYVFVCFGCFDTQSVLQSY
jgi:hypothetical protein